MNIHYPEHKRQHEAAMAARKRLWGNARKPVPQIAPPPVEVVPEKPKRILVQQDYHVWLYRLHRIRFPFEMSTSTSFQLEQDNSFRPYEASVDLAGEAPKPMMRDIVAKVLKDHPGVSFDDVRGHRRTKHIIAARQIAMYQVARQRPDKSYPEIGRFFGGKDHTTVLHAVRKCRSIFEKDSAGQEWVARKSASSKASTQKFRYMTTQLSATSVRAALNEEKKGEGNG